MKYFQIFLLSFLPLFGNGVISSKKAITITNSLSLKKAKQITKQLPSFDIYIYKTTTTKTPYFILYAVNIEKSNLYDSLNLIKKRFRSAYPSSDKRIKSLSLNKSKSNILVKATKLPINSSTPPSNKKQFVNTKEYIPKQRTTQREIDYKEKKEIWINPIKDAISLFTARDLNEAKKIASGYKYNDIYIHNRKFFYSIYIVNLKSKELKPLLNYLKKTIPTAKQTSRARIRYYAKNKSSNNLFIPSQKRPEAKVLKIVKKTPKAKKIDTKLYLQAKKEFNKNNYKVSINLLNEFLKDTSNHINGNFLLGRSYYLDKQYEQALATYEKILILNNDLPRVRLELAQTYLILKMPKEALAEFNIVLNSQIPQNVKNSIKKRIAFIKSQGKNNSFNFKLAFNYIYDTNINDTTSINSYEIYAPVFNSNLTLFSDEKQSDYYKLYQFAITNNYKVKDNTRLENVFSLSSQNYTKFTTKNSKDFSLSSYISKYMKKDKTSIGVDITRNDLNNIKNQLTLGLGSSYQYKLSKNLTNMAQLKVFRKYYEKQTDKEKESNNIQLLLGNTRKTKSFGTINTLLQFSQQQKLRGTRTDIDQNNYGIIFMNNYKWDHFISSTFTISGTKNIYKLEDINFLTKRKDTVYLSSASMNFHFTKNLTSSLNLSYTKSVSNHEPFDYDKTVIRTGIVYTF